MSGYSRDPLLENSNVQNFTWIHELARTEVYPDADKLLGLQSSNQPEQLIEESAILFLNELREQFGEYSKLFNSYSENGKRFSEVKIYSTAQTAADFMVFRNQVKLMVGNVAHGVIRLSFSQHTRGVLAVDGQNHEQEKMGQPNDLLAQIGPFGDVSWTFRGEKVNAVQVAKYYFAEFIRTTRDQKKSKLGNQLLLEQIKSLLKEKGLDL